MNNNPVVLNNWNLGGISESRILGENDRSLYKMVGTDVHSKVGLLSANRRLAKISESVVDGFVKRQVACSDGALYWFSSTNGKIWKYTSGTPTNVYTVNAPTGSDVILGACEYNGYLYFATQNYLYKMPVSSTSGTWSDFVEIVGKLNYDPAVGDAGYLGGIAADSDLGTSLSESAGAWTGFTPQLRTGIGIAINIKTKPSTSLTVTLHDSANTEIATKTIANADLAVGINEIYWTNAVNYVVGEGYHLHIFQTGTGGEVYSAVANNLTNAYLELYGNSNGSYHPMIVLNGILFIGDGRFIHQVENYLVLNALDIPSQYVVTCLGKIATDLLIGTEVSSSVASAMIFRWNTWSVSWSIEDDIEETGINAFIPVDNFVYVVAGKRGNVYFYNGERLELFRRIGGEFTSTDAIKVHYDAVASFHGIPLIGVSNVSGNPIEQGVYAMGTANPRLFPRIFDLEYVISQGASSIEIGSICVFGSEIFVSWKNGDTYGVDGFQSTDLYSGAYIQTRVIYRDRNSRTVYRRGIINYMDIQSSTPSEVTFNASTDKASLTGHGFQEAEPIVFATSGTLPAELTAGTVYYVLNRETNAFQISATAGGTAINMTSAGTGTHTVVQNKLIRFYYRKDYDTAWTELDLIHDTDKQQFITEDWGDFAFCLELKLELRSKANKCPVIDELTLVTQ